MAFQSANVANTLLQTLQNLTTGSEQLVVTRDTVRAIDTLISVVTILIDSADSVAEATADPTVRSRTFDYSRVMRNQIPILQQLRVEIDKNPSEPSLKSRLLGVATEIANATSSMLMSDTNEKVQRVADTAKKCAEHTKNLVTSFERGSQEFIEECKSFASSALDLTKALQDVAAIVEDRAHQKKIIEAYTSIKEFAPQIIRGAKRAYENPKNLEYQQELTLLTRKMASIISHALSVAQVGNAPVEIGKKEDTVPIPKVEVPQDNNPRRRRTIKDAKTGRDVLQKARTAAVAQEVNKTIEEGSSMLIQKQNAAPPPAPVSNVTTSAPEIEEPPKEDKEIKEQTESFIQTIRSQKETINPNELEQLRSENSLLKQEIEELKEEIESLKKKVADRDARVKALIAQKK
jgi:uncharacterized phage infection (PIP) family protein YhgE